jgi:flagellar protein FliO/FliZ
MTRLLAPIAKLPQTGLAAALTAGVPLPAAAAPGVDVADLSGVLLSLALVVGFIFAAAFVLKRTPFGAAGRNNGLLKVTAALPLGPRERLLLVEVRGEELLIAVSPAGVVNVRAAAAAAAAAVRNAGDSAPQFVLGAER